MISERRWRLSGLVLALVFSANTTLLPFADAVLEHGHPSSHVPADHLEGPGGCGAHAEHCLLTGGVAAPVAHPVHRARVAGADAHRAAPSTSATHPYRPALPALPSSRAPPAPIA